MSTLTDINDNDVVAESNEVINQNFDNLNTDKMEKSNNLSDLSDASVAKTNLGLGNVNNTSDANKPVSTAQQTALDLKLDNAKLQRIYKSADETVNNSNTLQDDDHLVFPVGANEAWGFYIAFFFNSGATPDLKTTFTVPSGATLLFGLSPSNAAAKAATEIYVENGSDTLPQARVYNGFVYTAATPGNVQFQWAQNTMTAVDSKVLKGSHIVAYKLA